MCDLCWLIERDDKGNIIAPSEVLFFSTDEGVRREMQSDLYLYESGSSTFLKYMVPLVPPRSYAILNIGTPEVRILRLSERVNNNNLKQLKRLIALALVEDEHDSDPQST